MVLVEPCPVSDPRRDPAVTSVSADRTVVWLRGELDVSTGAEISERLARAIALDDGNLIVDLSDVQFMDAATVGVIIRAGEFLRLRSRSLALRSPSASALRILDLCGLVGSLGLGPIDLMPTDRTADSLGSPVAIPATVGASQPRPEPCGSTL